MARDNNPDITLHLLKAGKFDLHSDERYVVHHLLRVGYAHDAIYPEVARLSLFNKLNELGLEVFYDNIKKRMYLSSSSINNYFENAMSLTEEIKTLDERSYYEKYIQKKPLG